MPPKRKAKKRRASGRRKRRRRIYRPSVNRPKSVASDEDFELCSSEEEEDEDEDSDYECTSESCDEQGNLKNKSSNIETQPGAPKRNRNQPANGSRSGRSLSHCTSHPLLEFVESEDEDFLAAVQNSLRDLEHSTVAMSSVSAGDFVNGDVHLLSPTESNPAGKCLGADKRKGKEKVIDEEEEMGLPEKPLNTVAEDAALVCGVCLTEEFNVEQGKLDCCDHFFCFECIMEWAKVESRCPMCKQRFISISKASNGSKRARTVRIPLRNQVYVPPEDEDEDFPPEDPYEDVVCMECHGTGDEGLLLLCDRCDSAAHTFCVGLGRTVPRGDWFCRACHDVLAGTCGSENERVDLVLGSHTEDEAHDVDNDDNSDGEYVETLLREIVASPEPGNHRSRQARVQQGQLGPSSRSSTSRSRGRVRSGTRRRIRRRLPGRQSVRSRAPPRLSQAARTSMENSIPETPASGSARSTPFFGSRAGSARTVPQQRRLQQRIQIMRSNWNRIQRGELQFNSLVGDEDHPKQLAATASRNSTETVNPDHPIATTRRNNTQTSTKVSSGPGECSAQKERELDEAWLMWEHAKNLLSLDTQQTSYASDKSTTVASRQTNNGVVHPPVNSNIKVASDPPLSNGNESLRANGLSIEKNCDVDASLALSSSSEVLPRLKPLDGINVPRSENPTVLVSGKFRRERLTDHAVDAVAGNGKSPCAGNCQNQNGRSGSDRTGLPKVSNNVGTGETSTSRLSSEPDKVKSGNHVGSSNSRSCADRNGASERSGVAKVMLSPAKEGLKLQLTEIVKKQIWPSYIAESLGKEQFKQIARAAVHTLLVLCDPKNESVNISCGHLEKQGFSPIPSCCGKCFNKHVERAVATAKGKVVRG